MDNYGTVDNPARISTVLHALMLLVEIFHFAAFAKSREQCHLRIQHPRLRQRISRGL